MTRLEGAGQSTTRGRDRKRKADELESESSGVVLSYVVGNTISTLGSPRRQLEPELASNSSPCGFKYKPLDPKKNEIRLLELLPKGIIISRREDKNTEARLPRAIRARLVHVSLDDNPQYEALSYTWGDSVFSQNIRLDGQSYPITKNLREALRHFQGTSTSRTFWIDAICIDQNDVKERNHQVDKMRIIYEQAQIVRLWLGMGNLGSRQAFQLLHELKRNLYDDHLVQKILRDPDRVDQLKGLINVFDRDYWWRIWVVQEVLSAKAISVHCGEDTISWLDLQQVQETLAIEYTPIITEVALNEKRLKSLEDSILFQGPRLLRYPTHSSESELPGLYEMLLEHRNKEATNPKDRIYAIIGLTTARDDPRIFVDYGQTTRQIYTGVINYIVSTTSKLDVICVAREILPESVMRTANYRLNLPSWVPDWSFCSRSATIRRDFAAARNSAAKVSLDCERGILWAKGVCIAKIWYSGVRSLMRNYSDIKRALSAMCSWYGFLKANTLKARDAFIRTIICEENNPNDPDSARSREELQDIFGALVCQELLSQYCGV